MSGKETWKERRGMHDSRCRMGSTVPCGSESMNIVRTGPPGHVMGSWVGQSASDGLVIVIVGNVVKPNSIETLIFHTIFAHAFA